MPASNAKKETGEKSRMVEQGQAALQGGGHDGVLLGWGSVDGALD